MHSGIKLTVVFLILFIFISLTGGSLLAMDLPKQMIKSKKYNPKLEGVLDELGEKYRQSKTLAQGFASQRGITFQDDRVTVILVPLIGEEASVIDRAKLLFYGAVIEASSQHFIRVRIPISALEKVADNVSGVSYIRLPYKPFPGDVSEETDLIFRKFKSEKTENNSGIISQGVSLTGASEYHDLGYKGQNIKIAVIDTGFEDMSVAQANGELPEDIVTKDFSGTGLQATRNHGTAVGEIVYDMAPQAQLYFIKVADEVDLENAKDYCIMQGINIISHSWIWFNTNFTDGTGFIGDMANDARSHGLFWVNAAGNQARLHYQGFFQDTDGDNFHQFALSPIDETNALEIGERSWAHIFLTWDDWPVTSQDYDLYLFDSNGNIIAQSENLQTGSQPPAEEIYIPWPTETYYIAIRKVSTTYDSELKLHVFTNPSSRLQYYTSAHSVVSPADATGVIAVGAITWKNWNTGPQKDYSSQGPTNDGRIKPDICGPTDVSDFTLGSIGGTSSATPHVVGAAALLLSRYPDWTASQLQATLEAWAVDMGVSGKDNIYGSGRLRLLDPPLLSWTGEANYELDGLNPEKGDTSTEFIYRIKYISQSNYPPENGYPKIHILKNGFEMTGSPFSMSEVDLADTLYTDGKLYTYTKTGLSMGTGYSYRFEAYDAHNKGLAVGDPLNERMGPLMVFPLNLESLIVYPNPFSLSKGHSQINFDGLTGDAKIRVFALTGELLREEEVSWQYSWLWNVRNTKGEELARGIYLWIVTNVAGERKIGKIAIMK